MIDRKKPNIKLIREWIAALRSRKYKQGTGLLRQDDSTCHRFCCFGVLCDIIDNKLWKKDLAGYFYFYKNEIYCGRIPNDYIEELGIPYEEQSILIHKNDFGRKFYEIANYLERRFKKELTEDVTS